MDNVTDRVSIKENYISMGLGLLVVLVIGLILINSISSNSDSDVSSDSTELTVDQKVVDEDADEKVAVNSTYTVKEGDTLWSISERAYDSGYNWVDIVEANSLSQIGSIAVGQDLKIPDVPRRIPINEIAEAQTTEADSEDKKDKMEKEISLDEHQMAPKGSKGEVVSTEGSNYVVKKGDTLWSIAMQSYGNPYKWVNIAEANNLTMPDQIEIGDSFILPMME